MAYRIPTCKRCGRAHYNFEDCDPRAEYEFQLPKYPPVVVRAKRADGLTDWQGDKLDSFSERRGRSFRLPRLKPVGSGSVVAPGGRRIAPEPLAKPKPTLTYPEG